MNDNNLYFSCFSLIRACVSSLFDNFFKVVAVCLIVCFVLLSPAVSYASTTESMMKFSLQNDYSVSPTSLFDEYIFNFSSVYLNSDGSLNTYSIINGTNFGYVPGQTASALTYVDMSGTYGSVYPGSKITISNRYAQYQAGVFRLFDTDAFIDIGLVRSYVFDNNTSISYNISSSAVPIFAYALADIQYSYQYTDEDGNIRTSSGNTATVRLPVEVYNDGLGYLSNDSFYTHIRIHGYTFSDLVSDSQVNYFDDIALEDISRFNASTNDITIYYFYSLSDYVNSSGDLLDDTSNLRFVSGARNNPDGLVLNLYENSNTFGTEDTFSLKAIGNSLISIASNLSSGMGSIVTNATQNADRIIQNTTNKINEVKQGVTEVKDSVVETKNSILDLPNKIKDMLLGLIIPSDEDIAGKYDEFSSLLEAKLGVIYQIPAMILELFQTLLSGVTDPQTTLTFPSLSLPWIDGTQMKLWDSIEFEIIPTGMDVLKELIQTVTSMVCVIMTFNSVKRIYENFLRGR